MHIEINATKKDITSYGHLIAQMLPRYVATPAVSTINFYRSSFIYPFTSIHNSHSYSISNIHFNFEFIQYKRSSKPAEYQYAVIGQLMSKRIASRIYYTAGILKHTDSGTMELDTSKTYIIKWQPANCYKFANTEYQLTKTANLKVKEIVVHNDGSTSLLMPDYGRTFNELISINANSGFRSDSLSITERNKLSTLEILQLMSDLALALKKQCTDRAIIHRDINPFNIGVIANQYGNILSTSHFRRYKVTIFDYGFATTSPLKVLETLPSMSYQAPEVKNGMASYQADIYSLGMIFQDLLYYYPSLQLDLQTELLTPMIQENPEKRLTIANVITILDQHILLNSLAPSDSAVINLNPFLLANQCLAALHKLTKPISHTITNKTYAYELNLKSQKQIILNHAKQAVSPEELSLFLRCLHIAVIQNCQDEIFIDMILENSIETLKNVASKADEMIHRINRILLQNIQYPCHEVNALNEINENLKYNKSRLSYYNMAFDDVEKYCQKLTVIMNKSLATIAQITVFDIKSILEPYREARQRVITETVSNHSLFQFPSPKSTTTESISDEDLRFEQEVGALLYGP